MIRYYHKELPQSRYIGKDQIILQSTLCNRDLLLCEFRVTNYELQAASYELRVGESRVGEMRVTMHGDKLQCELRVTSCELRVASNKLRVRELFVSVCMSVSMYVYPYVCMYVCYQLQVTELYECLSVCPSLICLYMCLSVHMSVCLFVCMSVWLSVCLHG